MKDEPENLFGDVWDTLGFHKVIIGCNYLESRIKEPRSKKAEKITGMMEITEVECGMGEKYSELVAITFQVRLPS